MSAPDGLPPLRDVVARHGLEPKKALGQNFLYDLNLTGRIARASPSWPAVAIRRQAVAGSAASVATTPMVVFSAVVLSSRARAAARRPLASISRAT